MNAIQEVKYIVKNEFKIKDEKERELILLEFIKKYIKAMQGK